MADSLQAAFQTLAQAPCKKAQPRLLYAQTVAKAEGRTVLDAKGEKAEALEGYAAEAGEFLISRGGFLSTGDAKAACPSARFCWARTAP